MLVTLKKYRKRELERIPVVAQVIEATLASITGKIETKARFLGMRLAFLRVCCRPLLLQQEILSSSLFLLRPINGFLNPTGLSLVRHLVTLLSYPHQTAPSQQEPQYLLTNH